MKNNVVIVNFQKKNNVDNFAEWCPNPIIEVDQHKKIIYLNLSARTLFPNIMQLGMAHPVFEGVTEEIDFLLEKTGEFSILTRELKINKTIFEQQIFAIEDKHSVMVYMVDITNHKTADEAIERINKAMEEQNQVAEERFKAMHAELRKSYELLQKNKEQYAYALKAASLGIWNWDLPRDVLFLDEHTLNLLGIDSIAHTTSFEALINYVHPKDREALSKTLRESCELRVECCINFRILLSNGETRYLNLKGKTLSDKLGQFTKMSGIITLINRDVVEGDSSDDLNHQSYFLKHV